MNKGKKMPSRSRLPPLYLGLFVLLADLGSKLLTKAYLPLIRPSWPWYPYGGIGIFKNFLGIEFSLNHQINKGAAWGAFSEFQIPLLYIRCALVAGLFAYALLFNRQKKWDIPLILIIAGAIGNIVDYFLYGHVIDMLHFVLWGYEFPVFNLADSAIFIGVCWMVMASWIERRLYRTQR